MQQEKQNVTEHQVIEYCSTNQSVDDLMFHGGEHPFKLLRLGGNHGGTQVGVASYRSERHTNKHTKAPQITDF